MSTMTESQRVERLARRAYQYDKQPWDPDWESIAPSMQDDIRSLIRDLIASDREAGMVAVPREPTEVMKERGSPYLGEFAPLGREYASAVYHAMIAAYEQEE